MRRLLACGALLLAVTLTGCAAGTSTAAPTPTDRPTRTASPAPTTSPSPTAPLPAVEWRESPEYEACVDLYGSVEGASRSPINDCALLLRESDVATLKAAFAPDQIELRRQETDDQSSAW